MAKNSKSSSTKSKTKTKKKNASKQEAKKTTKKSSTAKKSSKGTSKAAKKASAKKSSPKKSTNSAASKKDKVESKREKEKNKSAGKKDAEKKIVPSAPTLPSFSEVFNKKTVIILLIVIGLGLLYILRGQFLAAMVNGKPITRLKIMTEAEKMQGQQVLDNLVMESLIQQKAREKGVQISDELVDAQIDQIKEDVTAQGQDFEQLLAFQGFTMDELRHQIRIQQTVEALVSADIELTEEEIEEYIEDNKDFLPEEMTDEELRELVVEQLQQQKLSERYQQWSEDLRDEANIQYFGQYDVQMQDAMML